VRTGSDIYRLNIDQQFARGNLTNANPSYSGAFLFINDYRNDNNSDFVLAADRNLTGWLSLSAIAGGAIRREYFRTASQQTRGISVPGIYNPSNAAISPTLGQTTTRRQVNSAYGSASFTVNEWWTLEATGRNDWSSTLPEGSNSYFYPSLSTAFVVTDAVPGLRDNRFLSFAKLRASVARVGNDAPPYQLQSVYVGNPNQFNSQPQFSLENALANSQLKPEITKSVEGGAELSFMEGLLTLDASIYRKNTTNQIFPVTVSPTSGFTSKYVNAGEISNQGVEALLSISPFRGGDFGWTTTFNYGRNKSKVVSLTEGIETIVLGTTIFGEATIEAREGHPYGVIYGTHFARDDQGRLLVSDGLPFAADTLAVLGNIQPKWTGGWNNQFTFKNFSLNMLLDIKSGGDIFSHTNSVGEYSGVLESSLRGREIDFDNPGIVVNGIDVDTDQPNTENVTAEHYFQGTFPTAEPYVYNGGYVKLRELRFGIEMPGGFAQRFGAQAISIALTGRNLKTWTDVPNIDPEFVLSSTNNQGIEYAIPANPRSVGFSVRITP
jgi:outer membrane receptor protein involved in Fe transport